MKNKQILQITALGLVLLLCIGVYILLKQKNNDSESDIVEESGEVVISMESSDISRLSYTYEGEQLDFVLEDGSWYYESDRNFPLDSTYLENILATFCNLLAERRLEENLENIEEYGLDIPQLSVTAVDNNGKEATLYIGNCNESTGNYYCYLKDTQIVYMINQTLASDLKYKLYDMAKMESLPTISASSVYEISIGKETYVYSEAGKPEYDYTGYATWFHLNEDGSYTAVDGDTLSGIVSTFTGMSYQSMVEYNADEEALSYYGLDQPDIIKVKYTETYEKTDSAADEETSSESITEDTETLTVEKEFSLLVGNQNEDGNYYVKTQDSSEIKVISASSLETLLTSDVATLRNQSVFRIKRDYINSIILKSGNMEYTLMENSELVKEEDDSLYSKLYGMTSEQAAAEEFIPDTQPELTIVYSLNQTGWETVTMSFYEYNGSYYVAEINGETGLLVTKALIKDIISAISESD